MARGRKLDSETVNQIHELLRQKVPYSQIHERLGVSKGIISKIANMKSDSPAQRINNERKMNDDQTLNNDPSSPGLSNTNRQLPKIPPWVQSQKMNDERDEPIMNFEHPSTPIDQKAHPISTRQMIDECLDIAFDITWNRGSKKVNLKKLQGNLYELREREQLPE